MLLVRTYLAPSSIEGLGIFAAEDIRAGTRIWQSDPDFDVHISMARYEAAPPQLRELLDRYAYPAPDRPGFLIFESDNGRFMNHSRQPNTDFSTIGIGWALRDIAAGEEITCDYEEFDLRPDAVNFTTAD